MELQMFATFILKKHGAFTTADELL